MRRHRCATSCLGCQLQNAGQQGSIRHMTTLNKHHQSLHTLWDQIIPSHPGTPTCSPVDSAPAAESAQLLHNPPFV